MKKVFGIVFSLALISLIHTAHAFTIAHPCQTVREHLQTMQVACTGCIDFSATLNPIGEGGSASCQIVASTNHWYRSRLGEKFAGVTTSGSTELSSAFGDYTNLSFTYNIPDANVFTNDYDHYQISYHLRFGSTTGERIYFTNITYTGPTVITFGSGSDGGSGSGSGGGGGVVVAPIACAADGSCPAGLSCNATNVCEATLDTSCPAGETATVDATGATVCVASGGGSGADGSSGPLPPGTRVGQVTIPDQSNSNSSSGMCQLNPNISFDGSALNLGWIVLGIVALATVRRKKI